MEKKYIVALDQGTTSSRAIIFDRQGVPVGMAGKPVQQIYPNPGWVEHDPEDILQSQLGALMDVLKATGIAIGEIHSIGITNQRETVVIWDRDTGRPVHNAIVWQCRRTAAICSDLKEKGLEGIIRDKTGLVVDAYFSGTKIQWLLDRVEGLREKASQGQILAGTMDSWLLWNLTGGRIHATDCSNASRTMLYNIHDLKWDKELLDIFGIPEAMLPEVKPSSGFFGETDEKLLGAVIPIAGMAGDQQAALFGQACFEKGSAKNTYGTGCFILMNTGHKTVNSQKGLITTIAWDAGNGVEYALEGSIFNAGSAIQWLRDEMGLMKSAQEGDRLAETVPDTGGVFVVPAFTGLGAPYWDMYARGTIVGITRGTGREHIIRATLEAIAYQSRDVFEAMSAESGIPLKELKVDGGASNSNFLMQFQADLLGVPVNRPKITETTALGAAMLAGLGSGFWSSIDELATRRAVDRVFLPGMEKDLAEQKYRLWKRAVERAKNWAE